MSCNRNGVNIVLLYNRFRYFRVLVCVDNGLEDLLEFVVVILVFFIVVVVVDGVGVGIVFDGVGVNGGFVLLFCEFK